MSSQSLRRVLASSLMAAAFLSLGVTVPARAADLSERLEVSSLWRQAWQWLTEQISPIGEDPDAAAPGEESVAGSKSDAGWTLDPDG